MAFGYLFPMGCPFHRSDGAVLLDDLVCVSARSALKNGTVTFQKEVSMQGSAGRICEGLYGFIAQYAPWKIPASFVVTFEQQLSSENDAARSLCELLHQMHLYDKMFGYSWADGISPDPYDPTFSYSIGGHAFFVPFLHPYAHSPARRSKQPLLVFNAHGLFENLKANGVFNKLKSIIRGVQREKYGFVPALLEDYGAGLEYPQYLLPAANDVECLVWTLLQEIGGERPFG